MVIGLAAVILGAILEIAAANSAAAASDIFPNEVRNCAFDEHKAKNESVYHIRPDILCVRGRVEKELFDKIETSVTGDTKYFVVRSQGGDLDYGLKVGKIVFDRQLTVVVDKGCFSACANFIFLAAPKKIILENSVVGWHGTFARNFTGSLSMLRKFTINGKPRKRPFTDAELKKMWRDWGEEMTKRQEAFFQYTKIPYAILFMDYMTVISREAEGILQEAGPRIPPKVRREVAYSPNCFDMEHIYHIDGIIYCWHPETPRALFELGRSFDDSEDVFTALIE